ncbi:hypothetical protein CC117_14685 [Parafrankia colletiae]|uniref:Uncharacterized protein n=1 Tax=Parafrankia colletiae TaxID=573497 RepID=A0A1S1R3Z9_9ACTN|nr:hypothetical protein [Parafrankia colletiae]MCK9898667.1 hypothetical protein [Frankia sp. Cpl3]OHV39454.1 hypothetical protein CC117_14685 [Parafrankia colletiae]
MTVYRCPRGDLGCAAVFPTTGDLDYHLNLAHGYGRLQRFFASMTKKTALPVGPKPVRRVPDGLEGGSGTPTTGQVRRQDTRAVERDGPARQARPPVGRGRARLPR